MSPGLELYSVRLPGTSRTPVPTSPRSSPVHPMRNLLKGGLRRLANMPQSPKRPLGTKKATVIAVSAQKGGVGKTATSVSLAAALARFHGLRVLLVDLDPQGHVAAALHSAVRTGGGPLSGILLDEKREGEVMDVVTSTAIPNLYVTPLDKSLGATENLLSTRKHPSYRPCHPCSHHRFLQVFHLNRRHQRLPLYIPHHRPWF